MAPQSPKQVLIVDDSDDYSNLLVRFMNKAFPKAKVTTYNPLGAGTPGPDFDWSRFDVLIMEYRLGPEENGLDWLRKFKRDHTRFPATILLTASGNEDIAVRALRYGAHDYLRKQDLSAQRLAESISDAFNTRARQSSATQSLTINASRFSKSFFYPRRKLPVRKATPSLCRSLPCQKTKLWIRLHVHKFSMPVKLSARIAFSRFSRP